MQGDWAGNAAYSIGRIFKERERYNEENIWLRKACEAGYDQVCYRLANNYADGNGVAEDKEKAIEYYRKAYEMGGDCAGDAANSIGKIFNEREDYNEANIWFRKACEAGSGWGWVGLADNYADGNGVKEDKEKAIEYYLTAYEMGGDCAGDAAFGVGCIFNEREDYNEANIWFRKACESGSDFGWFGLASSYKFGNGVAEDKEKAIEYCRKAYEMQGDCAGMAADSIGEILDENEEYMKAYRWFQKAAEADYDWGYYHLGNCYLEGKGVAQNAAKAVECFTKAYEMQDSAAEDAKERLDELR